jgi:uncharacterized protein
VASHALAGAFAYPRGVAFAWIALLALLRLATRPGIFARPLSMEQALQVVTHWLDQPRAQAIEHGATLLTFDRDFERFAGLEWRLNGDA